MIVTSGIGSGLDISGLVNQLVAAERAGSDLQLNRQNAKLNAKFSALGSLKNAVSSFKASLGTINSLSNFSKNTATSSDDTELLASASSTALAGNYSIDVSQLAKSHSLASTAFEDSDTSALGAGTLTIRFGQTDYDSESDTYNSFALNSESSVATIDIDSSNNTLEGIMGAINDADIGVSASIINDGSGFRLLMTSESTGEENSLEISVLDADGNHTDTNGLSAFAFSSAQTNLEQTTAAQDAQFTVNGISISDASNSVKSALPGVTLNLKSETSSTIEVSVKQDFSAVGQGVEAFIAGYNQFIKVANELSAYDVENDIPSVLLGDFTLRSINGQIDNIVRSAVSGISGSVATLSELGITTTSSGTLELDADQLAEVLTENPQDVARIFSALGAPDDGDISYKSSTNNTMPGSYNVNITTLASAGYVTSASVLPDFGGGGTVLIDSDNDSLNFEVEGVDIGGITLTAGTYSSGSDLADEIQAQINGTEALREADLNVEVVYDSGSDSFTITSNRLGSSSTVNVLAVDINTTTSLGFNVGSGTKGKDVAGSIGGITATGVGNVLRASADSAMDGLSLTIEGTTTGNRGKVDFTRGLASQLDLLFKNLLDEDGALEERIDTYESRIQDVADRREELELRWEKVEDRYRRQFNALDSLMATLQSTSTYLEGQFENLLTPNTGNN